MHSSFPCPICSQESKFIFTKYKYRIRQCLSCEYQFLEDNVGEEHVNTVYGNSYFEGGGAGYPNYVAQKDILRNHGRQYGKILEQYMPPGKMLDVGAAAGFILQGFMDCGWTGEGVEPNDAIAQYGRIHEDLPIATGSLESCRKDQECDCYDLVSMIQVVPHFYDLHHALTNASELTKPGGFWLIETWNRKSIMARILGQQWHEYSPPSVLRWFGLPDLTALASSYGFERVASGRPRKWIRASHAKSLLRFKLQDIGLIGRLISRLLVLIPGNLSIPYPAEDLMWVLYKKMS